MSSFASILHLSDLHLTKDGKPGEIGKPSGNSVVDEGQRGDQLDSLFTRLKDMLNKEEEGNRPRHVIVNGDIVDMGDFGGYAPALTFLGNLAEYLRINKKSIYVVPGNHDVDWSGDVSQPERFAVFTEKMRDFTAPVYIGEDPQPVCVPVTNILPSVDLQILLLVSPTFSGVPDQLSDGFKRLLSQLLDKVESKEEIIEQLRKGADKLDVAAIGAYQRKAIEAIDTPGEHADPIRIAVMHHHLLPEPQLDLGSFEAVLDSGSVIESLLMNKFDLVLTGHKHNRRLAQYRDERAPNGGPRTLDVYSAPSLFDGTPNSVPGFTIIKINGLDNPKYITLETYKTEDCTRLHCNSLIREGRVLDSIHQLCASIPPVEQEEQLKDLLTPASVGLNWAHKHKAKYLFVKMWDELVKAIAPLEDKKLVFVGPLTHVHWKELLQLAHDLPKKDRRLRLVSENDIDFWVGVDKKLTFAFNYNKPILEFPGPKERIILLESDYLEDGANKIKLTSVIQAMVENRIRVRLALIEEAKEIGAETDFGLIGNIAVSRFQNRTHKRRVLEESFGAEDVAKAEEDWKSIAKIAVWDSNNEESIESVFEKYAAGG